MSNTLLLLSVAEWVMPVLVGVAIFAVIFTGIFGIAALRYGKIWFQAYMTSAAMSLLILIGMAFRQVNSWISVAAKLLSPQACLGYTRRLGMTTTTP